MEVGNRLIECIGREIREIMLEAAECMSGLAEHFRAVGQIPADGVINECGHAPGRTVF